MESVDTVWSYRYGWKEPTKDQKNLDSVLVIGERVVENHLKVGSFTHHPEVCGDGEIGHQDVEHPTPKRVWEPDLWVDENDMTPDEPGDVTEDDADEHVDVDRDSAAVETLVVDEDEEGQQEEDKRHTVSDIAEK